MPLSDIDALSDDAPLAEPAPQTPKPKKGKGMGKGVKKQDEKNEGEVAKVGKSPPPSKKKPKIAPKAKPEGLKRPAASTKVRDGADGHAKKKPAVAAAKKTDAPKKISVCKSLYKRDGVWSLKLNQKEVIRVT